MITTSPGQGQVTRDSHTRAASVGLTPLPATLLPTPRIRALARDSTHSTTPDSDRSHHLTNSYGPRAPVGTSSPQVTPRTLPNAPSPAGDPNSDRDQLWRDAQIASVPVGSIFPPATPQSFPIVGARAGIKPGTDQTIFDPQGCSVGAASTPPSAKPEAILNGQPLTEAQLDRGPTSFDPHRPCVPVGATSLSANGAAMPIPHPPAGKAQGRYRPDNDRRPAEARRCRSCSSTLGQIRGGIHRCSAGGGGIDHRVGHAVTDSHGGCADAVPSSPLPDPGDPR